MENIISRDVKGIYQDFDNKKLTGAHYTPTNLAQFTALRILTYFDFNNKTSCSIFDPAVGDGELLFALAELLLKKGISKIEIHGFDIDQDAIVQATERLSSLGKNIKLNLELKDFTLEATQSLPLFTEGVARKFDLVIANPPYVRTQSLGAKNSASLSEEYLLTGRIDLYYVFLMGITKFMHESSVAGFIVSNRFMTTKSGASVRKGLLDSYHIKEAWDLGDTKLFDAAVLPAVLVFSPMSNNSNVILPKFTSIYSTKNCDSFIETIDVFDALEKGNGTYSINKEKIFEVKSGELEILEDTSSVWRVSNSNSNDWIEQVKIHTEKTFRDLGKIRVGVKTTADKVFIKKNWSELSEDEIPEDEILRPLMTHHFAGRFKELEGNPRKILYPYSLTSEKKSVVDLKKYPRAEKYLGLHREQLEKREYLMQAGRNWFELWVPQEPSLWKQPKIVFRDICEQPTFWMDTTGSIVNGDCYWLTLEQESSSEYLWVALAVANSTFIEEFYDHKFNNKLYAGRRRFMTQYVEQFPIPKLDKSQKTALVSLTKKIYDTLPGNVADLEVKLDKMVWQAFGF